MVQLASYAGYVEYLKESTYGTVPGTGTFSWFGHVAKATVKSVVDLHELHRLRDQPYTNTRDAAEINPGLEHHSISVNFLAQAGFENTLELGLGDTASVADAVTSCVIVAVAASGSAEMYAVGCVCSSFEVKCEAGGEAEVTMEFLCSDVVETSTIHDVLSFTATDLVHATEISSTVYDYQNCYVTMSGSTLTLCTGFTFKYDSKAEERHRLFGSTPENAAEVVVKSSSISGQIMVDMQDTSEYDTLLARANVALTIVIGTKTFTFTGVKLGSLEVNMQPEDLIGLSIPFMATGVTVA